MRPNPLELPRVCSSMSSSVSISMTSEYRLFDEPRIRANRFEIGGFGTQARENNHGHFGRRGHHDFAAGSAAQPQIDDGGSRTMRLDRVQPFVRGFRGDDGVLPHLQKLDERLAYGAVVFDDENDRRCFSNHGEIIVLTEAKI